jgi:hypothetical protein
MQCTTVIPLMTSEASSSLPSAYHSDQEHVQV